MERARAPGKYKGGARKWEADLAQSGQNLQQSLTALTAPGVPDTPNRTMALSESHLALGLFSHWRGEERAAREHFSQAAALANAYVEGGLPGLTARRAPAFAVPASQGAIAAALSGQEALARTLFVHAERLSSGLVTGQEERPSDPGAVLDPMGIHPLNRAYALIRLGRLSGFHGLIYPEAGGTQAVWAPTDVRGLLVTAERCLELGRGQRPKDYPSQQGMVPLLRSLVVALEGNQGAGARQALDAYEDGIRDMADFRAIYLLMLDLRAAYPAIFSS